MAYENGPRSLIDDGRDILVYIPEAAEPEAERVVIVDRPLPPRTPWYERREAVWIVLGVAAVVSRSSRWHLDRPRSTSSRRRKATAGSPRSTPISASGRPAGIPVPESYRTHTANVRGSVDVLAVADFGPGAADIYVGSVTTADGSAVQQVFSDQVFTVATDRGDRRRRTCRTRQGSPRSSGQQVTFVGTLMPVPDDFATMVGSEAASIGNETAVVRHGGAGNAQYRRPGPRSDLSRSAKRHRREV